MSVAVLMVEVVSTLATLTLPHIWHPLIAFPMQRKCANTTRQITNRHSTEQHTCSVEPMRAVNTNQLALVFLLAPEFVAQLDEI